MTHWYELELCPNGEHKYEAKYDMDNSNAGFDLYSTETLHVGEQAAFIPFGVKVRLIKVEQHPRGGDPVRSDSHFWLLPRSSIYKTGLIMANSVGVIDSSYRGELKAPVWSMTGTSKVEVGDRLFQIVAPDMGWIRNVRIVDSLPETQRGEGGFGSTGK